MKLLVCPSGFTVITEGEPGDAFYIILEGTCGVHIKQSFVSELSAGCSFGEKALENNALRSATVICSTDCKLMCVFAADYKNIALCAQGMGDACLWIDGYVIIYILYMYMLFVFNTLRLCMLFLKLFMLICMLIYSHF